MQADYAAFAKANGVLPMPEGYTAPKQIFENAFHTLLVPRLLAAAPYLAGIAALFAALIMWVRRRRKAGVGG